jgi:glutathione-independent formaldehyde dehydrogenase
METNKGVAYIGPGQVELQAIDFPVLALGDRRCDHGVVLIALTEIPQLCSPKLPR